MEFRLMLDKITPQPSLRIGITAGANIPFVKLQGKYSNYDLQGREFSLKGNMGYQFGIIGEKALSKNISLEAGIGLSQIMFKYTISGLDVLTFQSVEHLYDQKVSWIEIPVLARYYFNLGAIKPYVSAGLSGRFSLYTMESSDLFGRYWFTESEAADKILATFFSDFENFGILTGCGASYDLKNISFRLDVRYNQNIKNSTVISNFDAVTGYNDIGPEQRFHYTDDLNLVSMKALQVSVGVLYNLSYKIF